MEVLRAALHESSENRANRVSNRILATMSSHGYWEFAGNAKSHVDEFPTTPMQRDPVGGARQR